MAGKEHEIGHAESWEALQAFGMRYRADAAVRAQVGSGDYSDLELELPEGTEVRVLEQTPDTFYFPLPPKPNPALSDEKLQAVAGGATANCYTRNEVLVAGSVVLCAPPPNARSCSG